jgi:putative oxidoreductase
VKPTLGWLTLFTRVMVGLLFGMSGYYKVFILTAPVHARTFFTAPYANNWMPHWLLLVTGLVIPFVELACGWLLVAGLFRRPAAIVLGFLLLLVTYGHELKEPVFNISTIILPRVLLLIPTWIFSVDADPYSLDALLARRKAVKS